MNWLIVSALFGASSILTGAFGAHGLANKVDANQLAAWKTAAVYQLVHALVLLALALFAKATGKSITLPASLVSLGILFFSGSIYGLVLGGPKLLGPITPIGGLLLCAGWVSMIFWSKGL